MRMKDSYVTFGLGKVLREKSCLSDNSLSDNCLFEGAKLSLKEIHSFLTLSRFIMLFTNIEHFSAFV